MNKEQAYDEQISPLMAQIVELCRKHGIAMLASFAIPSEDGSSMCWATCLPDENGKHGFGHVEALRVVRGERAPKADAGDGHQH